MSGKTVAERVKTMIAGHLGINDMSRITDEASLADDLNADSLDHVELIMTAEEEFGVEVADDDAERVFTVGDAVKAVESALQKQA